MMTTIRTATIERAALPVAPAGQVNVFAIPAHGGPVLIDCGMNTPDSYAALRASGLIDEPPSAILLTHAHPDHSGLAGRLRAETAAPLLLHRAEDAVFEALADPAAWLARQNEALSNAGVPAPLRARIDSASLMLRRQFPALRADGYLQDGDVLGTALGPLEVIHTPGHAAGHLCFYLRDQRVLFSGDHLLSPREPFLDGAPGCVDAYADSLRRLAALDVDWVMPSHGEPYRLHRARVDALSRRLDDVLARVRALRAKGLASAHDLAASFWDRPLSPFEHRNAVYEMAALMERA